MQCYAVLCFALGVNGINSTQELNEWVDDDDDEIADVLYRNGYGRKVDGRWRGEDPKSKYKRKDPKAAEARKAAMADIKKELDAEKHDDDAIEAREKADKADTN